jgi:hypothetical protein
MGRTGGMAVQLQDVAARGPSWSAARRPRRSVIVGDASRAPGWVPTSLPRLLRAFDLRPAGPQRFEATAAEPDWPAFPAAQLAAAAVVAAERCFPGYSVSHLACAFGLPARACVPLSVAMVEVRVGPQCVTGRMEFNQGGTGHGEAAVVLQPAAAGVRVGSSTRIGQATRSLNVSARMTALRRPLASLVPWELQITPPPAGPGSSCVWSRLSGYGSQGRTGTWSADGASAEHAGLGDTTGRALLAYLSELLPLAAVAIPYPDRGGRAPIVLSHAITYNAPFDLSDWLMATVDSCGAEGYMHARATFRTPCGAVAAVVSQAAAVWGDHPAMSGGKAERAESSRGRVV